MPFDKQTEIGHRERPLQPERQINILRRYLLGKQKLPYNTTSVTIWAAREAIKRAVNILITTGKGKGIRKYSDRDLKEMSDEMDRLEKLLKRKNKGENIEKEIDGPFLETEENEQNEGSETKNIGMLINDELRFLLDRAVVYYSEKRRDKANALFLEALQKLEKAKSEGVDTGDLEITIKSLSSFFL